MAEKKRPSSKSLFLKIKSRLNSHSDQELIEELKSLYEKYAELESEINKKKITTPGDDLIIRQTHILEDIIAAMNARKDSVHQDSLSNLRTDEHIQATIRDLRKNENSIPKLAHKYAKEIKALIDKRYFDPNIVGDTNHPLNTEMAVKAEELFKKIETLGKITNRENRRHENNTLFNTGKDDFEYITHAEITEEQQDNQSLFSEFDITPAAENSEMTKPQSTQNLVKTEEIKPASRNAGNQNTPKR